MPAAPLPPGLVEKDATRPAFVTPLFLREPVERVLSKEKAEKRTAYLQNMMVRDSYKMVKCLAEMEIPHGDIPCSPPATPSAHCRTKMEWENQSLSFRAKLRVLYKHILETPALLAAVTDKLKMKEQRKELQV